MKKLLLISLLLVSVGANAENGETEETGEVREAGELLELMNNLIGYYDYPCDSINQIVPIVNGKGNSAYHVYCDQSKNQYRVESTHNKFVVSVIKN
ncbi:MAG: hypothetical protein QG599_1725 [Pseudomonadota bacterium]|nr:hypothetical protein [Pseudomonadota bacterium]